MPTFTKDALYPGTYRLAGGRKVTYSRADIPHLAKRLRDMKAAGLLVPLTWAHRPGADGRPMSEEDRISEETKYMLGFADDAETTQEGFLQVKLDVPNEDDAKRLPVVRFISPAIKRDYIDGSGKKWPGLSIVHLAVTPRPVQSKQRPFKRVDDSTITLSLGDLEMAETATDIDTDAGDDTGAGQEQVDKIAELMERLGMPLSDAPDAENALTLIQEALQDEADQRGGEEAGAAANTVAMSLDRARRRRQLAPPVNPTVAAFFETIGRRGRQCKKDPPRSDK
jgi:hypothetical protein